MLWENVARTDARAVRVEKMSEAVVQSLSRVGARRLDRCRAAQIQPVQPLSEVEFQRDSQALKRRVARIRRAGMLDESQQLAVHQASTADELAQAYSLVHDVFVYQGYIEPQPGSMRLRAFEALPDMVTLVAKSDDRVVATMSVVPDSADLGLPSDLAFGKELDLLRAQNRRLAEVTNLALDPAWRNSGVFFELSRACAAHSLTSGLDDLFISISPGHSIFFETILGFESFGDRRNYSDCREDIVQGLRLDLTRFEHRVRRRDALLGNEAFLRHWFFENNPHYQAVDWSRQLARRAFLNSRLLRELFVTRSNYLARCDGEVLEVLRQRWGSDILAAVWPQSVDSASSCRELIVA
jgi:hypothetical protein